jgi:hypothetical protein
VIKALKVAAVLGFALTAQSVSSQATIIAFGTATGPFSPYVESGFSIDIARLVGGNCAGGMAACMALNKVNGRNPLAQSSVLTLVGGGLFTLNSFWGNALGQPSAITVKSFRNGVFVEAFAPASIPNTGQFFSHLFADVDKIEFINSGNGNLRIDDINVTAKVSAVPLPAGLPLLVSGLFGLGLLKRRKDKAQHAA